MTYIEYHYDSEDMELDSEDAESEDSSSLIEQEGEVTDKRHYFCSNTCTDADVIPLQSLGVVDVGAIDIEENEILAHALANVSQND